MNLLIEYYKSENQQRDQEYLFCIKQNILNPLVEKIYIFISDESVFEINDKKIEIVKSNNRPYFFDLFEFCNNKLKDQICIVANTDIIFDETIKNLLDFDLTNIFLSLTRWDIFFYENQWHIRYYDHPLNEKITTAPLSQDVWIFKSPIKLDDRCKFSMGKPGCDNRISQIMHENGYDVRNPSKKIITKHLHQTNHRTYNVNDTVLGPYLLIDPSDDMNIVCNKKTILHF